ncbi:MAG: NAD(P)H-hydrate dehydratase [Lachnospiraceae bacterium]|nr:NAD(P)H-hydrate dehydratase [Lachnospiraceae bacterium]
MNVVVDAAEMRMLDELTISKDHMPQAVLMERAALETFAGIKELVGEELSHFRFAVVAGNGNNGADGVALARLLHLAGGDVRVYLSGDRDRYGEALSMQVQILLSYISPNRVKTYEEFDTASADVVIDALFGTGLGRAIEGAFADVIQKMNASAAKKVAMDLPSGISADDGRILGCAFRANLTVTYGFYKRGVLLFPGRSYAGKVKVADIGIPLRRDIPPTGYTLSPEMDRLPERPVNSHKGTFGKVLLIAGSKEMPGASLLAGKAVLKCGAGMLKLMVPAENRDLVVSSLPEAMPLSYTDADTAGMLLASSVDWADVIAMGPGIGKSPVSSAILEWILTHTNQPLVLDADALGILADDAGNYQRVLDAAQNGRTIVLTPHVGELARLMHAPLSALSANRFAMTNGWCKSHRLYVISKDAATFVMHNDGERIVTYFNQTGNSGMATAGSGDVLTGVISSLLAQSNICNPLGNDRIAYVCALGVHLHGMAGDLAALEHTEQGMIAGDLAEHLPEAIRAMTI